MSEMMDRVARVIIAELYSDGCAQSIEENGLIIVPPHLWVEARCIARSIFLEMREPTGSMKDEGAGTYGIGRIAIGSLPLSVIEGQPTKAWQAMIDCALED